jgi:DNA-binding MarR family transcriptional regulator
MLTNIEILEQYGATRRALNRVVMPFLRDLGLGPKQIVTLRLVGKRGQRSMSEIAEGAGCDKASASRVVDTLVNAKWLERKQDADDRRQWLIKLSEKGKRNLRAIEKTYEKFANSFVEPLTANERSELMRLLLKIEEALKTEVKTRHL